jgi:hypothetical protein
MDGYGAVSRWPCELCKGTGSEQGEGEQITEAEAMAAMPHQDDRYEIRRLRTALDQARAERDEAQSVAERWMDTAGEYAAERDRLQARVDALEEGVREAARYLSGFDVAGWPGHMREDEVAKRLLALLSNHEGEGK